MTIEVFDRLPVSTDERIDISSPQMQPSPAEHNQKRGLLRFRLNLRAGEEQEIKIRYELSHPEGVLPRFRQTGGAPW